MATPSLSPNDTPGEVPQFFTVEDEASPTVQALGTLYRIRTPLPTPFDELEPHQALHLGACLLYTAVYAWHFSNRAAGLPAWHSWGWFYRYLTFWSFSIQLLLFTSESVILIRPEVGNKEAIQFLDSLACCSFPLAGCVSLFYYILLFATGGKMDEDGGIKPAWLDPVMHQTNSLFGLADILLSPQRTFSAESFKFLLTICVAYTVWLVCLKLMSGLYPYPFLNEGSFVRVGVLLLGLSMTMSAFATAVHVQGAFVRSYLQQHIDKVL